MHIIVDNFVPGRQFCVSQDSTTQMPYDYLVDHVKVWQLKSACDSVLAVPDIDPLTYDYTVKENIEMGIGGGSLGSGEELILRANEGITLNKGYEANLGSELSLLISDCMVEAGVFPISNPGGTEYYTPTPPQHPFSKPLKYQHQ